MADTDAPDTPEQDPEAPEADAALLGTAYPDDDAAEAEPGEDDPAPAPQRVALPGELARGHRGAAVVALQQALRSAGHEVRVDGRFADSTQAAVVAFQASQGLAETGVVDETTAAALGL